MNHGRRAALVAIMVQAFALLASNPVVPAPANDPGTVREEFERRYQEWRQRVAEIPAADLLLRGDPLLFPEAAKAYFSVMELGRPALPYIMEKIESGDPWLVRGLYDLTKRRFHISEYTDPNRYGDAHTKARMYRDYWSGGQSGIRRRFDSLAAEWHRLKDPVRTELWTSRSYLYSERGELSTPRASIAFTDAGAVYDAIRSLGIAVLPHIVTMLRDGDADFLPIALELTDGSGGLGIPATPPSPNAFVEWWEANKQDWLIPWPKEPPAE